MALDKLTKVDGGGISTTSDYRVGIITASKFVGPIDGVVTGTLTGTATTAVNAQGLIGTPDITVRNIKATGLSTFVGDAQFDGNVSIAGTLTYEDVTNIDSVGLITARDGIFIPNNEKLEFSGSVGSSKIRIYQHAALGSMIEFTSSSTGYIGHNASGAGKSLVLNTGNDFVFKALQSNGAIIDIARFYKTGQRCALNADGVEKFTTSSKGIQVGTGVTIETNGQATFVGIVTFGSGSTTIDNNVVNVGTALTLGHTQGVQFHTQNLHSRGFEVNQINASGIITASSFRGPTGGTATFQDIDVDGHTNLDNVSIAGVTTFAQKINLSDNFIRNCRGFNTGNEQARIVVKAGDNSAGGGLRIVEYYNDDTTLFSSEIANFYTNGIELKEDTTVSGNLTITENIVHAGDTDTRMRFSNDDTITFETGAVNRLHIDSNGRVFMGAVTSSTGYGNQVLITGTLGLTGNGSNVGMHFHRSGGDTEGYIGIGPWAVTGGGDDDFGIASKGDLLFGTSTSTWSQKMRVAQNGRVKIGTGEPKAQLDIKQVSNSWEDALLIQHDNANTGWNIHAERADSGLWFGYNSNTAAALADQSASQVLHLNSNRTTSLVTYNSSYELTIGGISGGPTLWLRDSGTTGTPRILFGSSSAALIGAIAYNNNNDYMEFSTDGEPRLRISSDETIDVSTSTNTAPAYIKINSNRSSTDDTIGGVTGVWNGNPIAGVNFKAGADTTNKDEGDIMMLTYSSGTPYERLRITAGGVVKIGGDVSNASSDVGTVTKLTIKQHTNTHEGGMYIERSGERRGWYMYVGGSGGYNDALCLTTNQMGTDTNVLAIDRGNRLVKLGGDVIIDSTNNGYGGLRIYDDSSGDYNVNYIAGRNQGATAHVFKRSGRTQNQSPWTDTTSSEIARLTHTNGISFRGESSTNIGQYTSHHLRVKTNDKERIHIDNRGVLTAAKLNTKAHVFSSCTNRWASQRTVLKFYMDFYVGNTSATYHFMRMISQPDWSFDDVTIKQIRYQYSPDDNDHTTTRFRTWYGTHYNQVINYNQKDGGNGTSAANWIIKRDNFGPGGAHKIHEAANGGYYRDAWGSDYAISLGNYQGVRLEITIYNTTGVYDTGTYATASDFYPAAYGGQATQSAADSWGGPRGVWFNTVANGTGSGSAPVLGIHQNNAKGWSTGSNFFDTSA